MNGPTTAYRLVYLFVAATEIGEAAPPVVANRTFELVWRLSEFVEVGE
jgi:hypothetical protein